MFWRLHSEFELSLQGLELRGRDADEGLGAQAKLVAGFVIDEVGRERPNEEAG